MNAKPIGIFDSGIGGITVLAKALELLPGEKFMYYGDSANAPYGVKKPEEVVRFSIDAAHYLIDRGIKALVVACNTATSVAIEALRSSLSIPVIGMEPALKPAVEMGQGGTVVVMATPLTLKEIKFNRLMENYSSRANILPMPCPGLVELIEDGVWEGPKIHHYLSSQLQGVDTGAVTDLVLGCTHYVFIKEEIDRFFNGRVAIFDGNQGTANQLKRLLTIQQMCNLDKRELVFDSGLVEFYFSSPKNKILDQCKKWVKERISGA